MLTSSNQYLRPDYLSPLPTTLDAKKSPLALLAQTCSAIGSDSPNPKLISAAEKASKKYDNKSPVIHVPDNKPSFKPYESCLTREKTRSPEDCIAMNAQSKTPLSSKSSTSTTPVQPRCGSNQSSSSQRTSPPVHRKTPSDKSDERSSPLQGSPVPTKTEPDRTRSSSASKIPFTSTSITSTADTKDHLSFKPSIPVTSSAYLGGMPPSGFPLGMDLMTSSLMAAQHHALKNGLNPYLAYARMKAPGSDLGICRDPYCTGCSLSSHLLKSATCPAGCSQCDHVKSQFSLPPGHPAAAAYAHAQLAALAAASQLPFVCSWIAGDSAYCGKRFGTSEELLQHLRSHTASGEVSPSMSLLGAHPLLQRSYPTPPLSPLTPRFHPYSKPAHLMSQSMPFPIPPPSLAAYFPSYGLFGPRPLHP